jgi:hypothetical protein
MASMFLASVWRLARQPYYWSPERFFRTVWTVAGNIPTQLKVLRVLSRPAYMRLITVNPRFSLKFMGVDYLARGLTIKQRAESFMHHYRRLPDVFPESSLIRILLGEILLDEIREENNRFAILMGLSRPYDNDGELSLNLEVNGKVAFLFSFTIAPGWVVRSKAKEVMLISRMHGFRGCYDEVRLATKTLHDIAPPALLFAALCGVAEAYGVHEMAGIAAIMKPEFYSHPDDDAQIQEAYDEFFALLGATKGPAGFYQSPLPPPDRPIKMIKSKKRSAHRRRTAIKRDITQRVYQALCDFRVSS